MAEGIQRCADFVPRHIRCYPFSAGSLPEEGPPDHLLHNPKDDFRFWRYRAAILHRIYPQLSELQLLLFSSSGFHKVLAILEYLARMFNSIGLYGKCKKKNCN